MKIQAWNVRTNQRDIQITAPRETRRKAKIQMKYDKINTKIDRRSFLEGSLAIGLPAFLAAPAAGMQQEREPLAASRAGLIMRQRTPENLEFPYSTLNSHITPNERFYIRSHFAVPSLEARSFRLKVDGAVDKPLELSYDDLKRLPSRTVTSTLECAGNGRVFLVPATSGVQWEHGAVSTAEWTGVPLAAILERAGVRGSAVEVILEGADSGEIRNPPHPGGKINFARSLPLSKAQHPDTLLAYTMNGAELPPSHGFPVRAVVPGWYGMASIKWLTRITVTEKPFQGYYQTIDYAYWETRDGHPNRVPLSEMQIKSAIARPTLHETISAKAPYRIFGAAWTGEDAQVSKVEVSTDGGQRWSPARLLGEPARYAWRFWELAWQPPRAGQYTIMARATDTRGRVQPMQRESSRENYMINHVLPISIEAR